MTTRRFHLATLSLAVALAAAAAPALAEEEGTSGAEAVKPAYPASTESLIEQRREAMQRRRDEHRDWRTGRRWRQPPWIAAQDDWMEQRIDQMNEAFRQRRDAAELQRDQWGRWLHPRSQWRQDVIDARRDARELDRLYRDERFERYRYGPPFGGFAPYYW